MSQNGFRHDKGWLRRPNRNVSTYTCYVKQSRICCHPLDLQTFHHHGTNEIDEGHENDEGCTEEESHESDEGSTDEDGHEGEEGIEGDEGDESNEGCTHDGRD